ncbi:MAG: bis(5'-nucleosyl)-tetraphosphatase (symmetrical) YqeK, partial [Candidatus Izemoplasma sp.]
YLINQIIYNDLLEYLKNKPHRLDHVIGVKNTALKLGKKYNLDLTKLETASYLHDMTKYHTLKQNTLIIKKNFENSEYILKEFNEEILHAFTAKALAVNKYNITDVDILNPILNHTIGKANMSIYEKVIFISDYTEPTRTYESCIKVRKIVEISIDLAVFTAIDDSIKFYEKLNSKIPQTAYAAREFYKNLTEVQK